MIFSCPIILYLSLPPGDNPRLKYPRLIHKDISVQRTYTHCVPKVSIPETILSVQMNPTGMYFKLHVVTEKKNVQRLSGCFGSLLSSKPGAVTHFADIITEMTDGNGDTKTNAQRLSNFGSLFSRKPGTVTHFADIISETSDGNVPGICANTISKSKTANTETSPEELTTEGTIEIDNDDDSDTAPTTSRPRINDPNNPYAYQCNLSQEKLDKLANDDDEKMDDDSLKAFLNILRIESAKPVIMVSSHYRNRAPRLGLTKSLYDGDLENFEIAIIPIHMPSTEAAHWVLGIYRRNESILYYDSLGITYGMVKTEHGMTLELVTDWVSETLKSAVRDITRDTQLDPKIEAVPLDGPQFDHYRPKYRINPQMDGVNCGFHIALIAEAFLMNNGEVFSENFDIAAERTRILDILSGLRDDNYRYIPRSAHTTPKDADIDQEMQQLDNYMNTSGKISNSCENAAMEKKSDTKAITNDHANAPVGMPEKKNQFGENTEEFILENDCPKASNQEQSPDSATNSDEGLPDPAQEVEVNPLTMPTDQKPIHSKRTEVSEKTNSEANAQPKTNVQRENLSRDVPQEDAKKKENETPKSNNESSAENENLRKKVQKLEENLAQFQEQLKQLQFEKDQNCSKATTQNIALESARPVTEEICNAPAIIETSPEAIPDPTDYPALTDFQLTFSPVVNQQHDINGKSMEKREVAPNYGLSHHNSINLNPGTVSSATMDNGCEINTGDHFQTASEDVQVSHLARAIMTTDQVSDNGNTRLSQQNEVHSAVDSNASNNTTATATSISTQTLKYAKVSNKQIGSRASKPVITPQLPLQGEEMPHKLRLRDRKQINYCDGNSDTGHDLPVEIKRSRLSRVSFTLLDQTRKVKGGPFPSERALMRGCIIGSKLSCWMIHILLPASLAVYPNCGNDGSKV
ncbi:hypothetical protein DdX_12808 [Ditylenchus destructor]|uniref:Ubiquitin-like protease family profile domain-containing protein n=1 Tax=Ditylenchus destructor TaxID=166010 RepID=A0AAD4MU07_9BILA|nr:hypothetical protein DdX_12808 [Ditylenchus destructor]